MPIIKRNPDINIKSIDNNMRWEDVLGNYPLPFKGKQTQKTWNEDDAHADRLAIEQMLGEVQAVVAEIRQVFTDKDQVLKNQNKSVRVAALKMGRSLLDTMEQFKNAGNSAEKQQFAAELIGVMNKYESKVKIKNMKLFNRVLVCIENFMSKWTGSKGYINLIDRSLFRPNSEYTAAADQLKHTAESHNSTRNSK